jgi:hypothetical protein
MNNVANIEDLLEIAAGFHILPKIKLETTDMTIMHSIGRQVFKGTALTDRQFALMQEKLNYYKDQFINLDLDFDFAVTQLRQPLREIDRSKYVQIVDGNEAWIKIRFPFKKSLIMLIQEISYKCENYKHTKGSHEHFFLLNDYNIYKIISQFKDKEFVIDEYLINRYNKIKIVIDNKNDYIPYFDGEKINNLSPSAIDLLKEEITEISKDNRLQVIDRSLRYGFLSPTKSTPTNVLEKIAFRSSPSLHIKPSELDLQQLLISLYDLNRFPAVILLTEKDALVQLDSIYKIIRNLIPHNQQSVLFRKEGQDDFNTYVKDKSLNNWVDKDTKIVYINNKKVPKVLLKSDWKPITSIVFDSFTSKEINAYTSHLVDLNISYEEHLSPFKTREYRNYYG